MTASSKVGNRQPRRIQRRRTKGWRMPDGAVYVGRPSVFGNPAVLVSSPASSGWAPWMVYAGDVGPRVGAVRTQAEARRIAADHFRAWLTGPDGVVDDEGRPSYAYVADHQALHARLHELAGRDLACWCPLDEPCHGDVLLEVANR